MCEQTLALKFIEGKKALLKENSNRLQVLNKASMMNRLQIDLIDFHQFAGVKISRAQNRKDGIKLANPFFMDLPNFSFYMPANPMQLASAFFGKQTNEKKPLMINNITLEVLVRIRTNIKLTLTSLDPKTKETIYLGTPHENEFHFLKFEGCLPPIEMSMEAIKKAAQNFELSDWTITDFDNCLSGNPHI